jgi:lipopolysaccharide transport system ATP-binding protein
MTLIPGRYRLTIYSDVNGIIADWIKNAAIFDVEAGDYYGTGRLPPVGQGMFLMDCRFTVDRLGQLEAVGAAPLAGRW